MPDSDIKVGDLRVWHDHTVFIVEKVDRRMLTVKWHLLVTPPCSDRYHSIEFTRNHTVLISPGDLDL